MRNRGTSIHDVARAAGVSISTVSKAFNGKRDLSEATRVRVLAVAADMHFVPNALIRSLRHGKTGTIGIYLGWGVHDDTSQDITGRLAKGFNLGLTEIGYDALHYVVSMNRTPDNIAATFLDGRVDGAIASPCDITEAGLEALYTFGLPVMLLYRRIDLYGVGYVAIDNEDGISQAVHHLVELGHRHIAFYAPYRTFDNTERADAYRKALREHGIEPAPALCIEGENKLISIQAACDRFLAAKPAPTAMIAADDFNALELLDHLSDRGISVPGQMSVVGFDDVDAAASAGLTTIRQPAQEVGKLAVMHAHSLILEESCELCRTVLPVQFIPRTSTGPANL